MKGKRIVALISVATMLLACMLPANLVSAAEESAAYEIFASEAETLSGTGYKTEKGTDASGAAYTVSTANGAELYCDFTKSSAVDNTDWYFWVRAFTRTHGNKLTLEAGNRSFDVGKIYTNTWKWYKVKFGKITSQNCTLTLTSNRKGIYIDRIVATNNPDFLCSGKFDNTSGTDGSSVAYFPANVKAAKKNYPAIRESEQGGSWFAEAEEGKLGANMAIVEDETASGEKYAHAESGLCTDPAQLAEPSLAFSFTVKEKGQYFVWARYFTPEANQKSSWISIDGKDYVRLETTVTPKWTWKKNNTVYLDEGLHTLEVKYRQDHHRLDCFIITKDGYTPKNLGSLPGEEDRPYALPYAERVRPRVYVNDEEVLTNTLGYMENDRHIVPVRNMCDKLGISYYVENDESIVLHKGREYVKLICGKEYMIHNGKSVALPAKVARERNEVMVDFASIAKIFNINYTIDESNQIYVIHNADAEVTWEQCLRTKGFESNALSLWGDYTYKCKNDFDSVTAWYMEKGTNLWKRAHNPVYFDGALHGGLEDLSERRNYMIKLSFVYGNKVKNVYGAMTTIKLELEYPTAADVVTHSKPGEIALVPTYENIGVYCDYEEDIDGAESDVFYREKGSTEWIQAYDLFADKRLNQFRGSIVGLTPGKNYEVKLSVKGKKNADYIAETTMWSDEVPIAKEYKLNELYDKNDMEGCLSIQYLKGSPDGWIKIKGTDGDNLIEASKNVNEAVWLSNCEYVILEDLIVKGGYKHGIRITNSSENIRITNCDISEYGIPTVLHPDSKMYCDYTGSEHTPNQNSGVRIEDVGCITVEKCYIHDPSTQTNSWAYGHPAGANAVSQRAKERVIIRNNDFIGSEYWRWNDVVEAFYNDERTGGPAKDCDIYGNVMITGQDDSIEIEGGEQNTRVYNNLMGASLCGISSLPMTIGPAYIFRNVWHTQGTENNGTGAVSKAGGGNYKVQTNPLDPDGMWGGCLYYFNNTMYTKGNGLGIIYTYNHMDTENQGLFKAPYITRNNIIATSVDQISLASHYDPTLVDFDYDLLVKMDTDKESTTNTYDAETQEKHKVVADPKFTNIKDGIWTLSAESPAIDKGEDLYEFTKGFGGSAPDIGAMEYGADPIFPVRDVNVKADKWFVTLTPENLNTTIELSLINDGEPQKVKLLETEFDKNWLKVTDENGNTEFTISKDKPVKINVSADPETLYKYGQMYKKARVGLVFKMENGHSIPVQIDFVADGYNPYRTH